MKSEIEVYTSPTCPYCPGAVDLAMQIKDERDDVEVKILSSATKEGFEKAQQYGIQTVPTILVKGPVIKNIIAFDSVPPKDHLNHAIDMSIGKAELKKGFS